MAAGLYALRGVEMAHEWTAPVTSLNLADKPSDLISDYKPAPLPLSVSVQDTTDGLSHIIIIWALCLQMGLNPLNLLNQNDVS